MTSVQVCDAIGAVQFRAFASGRRPRDTAGSGWKAPAMIESLHFRGVAAQESIKKRHFC